MKEIGNNPISSQKHECTNQISGAVLEDIYKPISVKEARNNKTSGVREIYESNRIN